MSLPEPVVPLPMLPEVAPRQLVVPAAPLPAELPLDMLPLVLAAEPVPALLSVPGFSAVPRFAVPDGPPGVPGGLFAVVPLPLAEPALELLDCASTDALAVANTAASAIARVFDVISSSISG
jgi:hypothetical protein